MFEKLYLPLLIIAVISLTACGTEDSSYSESETTTAEITTAEITTVETTTAEITTTEKKSYEVKSPSYSKAESEDDGYYCMGKGDTCNNKTSDPFDLYCYSCDPDGNNIEGDQRNSKSDGYVGDNDYDGDIDYSDWESEWNAYLDDKLNDYDYGYYGY